MPRKMHTPGGTNHCVKISTEQTEGFYIHSGSFRLFVKLIRVACGKITHGRLQRFWSLAVILREVWSHYIWLLFSTWGLIQNHNA